VINHRSDEFIEWRSADAAIVKIGKIVNGNSQQTITSRRKRFRKELADALAPDGWRVKLNGSRTVIERIGPK
jgi:hypothetical protein